MNEMTKGCLAEMLDTEIKDVNATISNNCLWAHGSETEEEAEMFTSNIRSLEDYRSVLLKMKEQIETEGRINVE